jgi:quercetin dioxygenase-like cupin family protein
MMVTVKSSTGFVEMSEGIRRQSLVYGERTHMVRFFLGKNRELPVHTHEEHEQTGFLLAGRMILTIDGDDHTLEPGDSWSIERGVPHGARMIEDSEVIEVFSPLREDYMD